MLYYTSTINAKSLTYSFSVSINSIILCLRIIIIIISSLYFNKHHLFYLRFSPYFVRSSTSSSVVVNDENVVWSILLSFKDKSSVCSFWLSFGITVIVVVDDDDVILFVVEVSSTDGVVIDKAAGIWKSLAENPETILIGA